MAYKTLTFNAKPLPATDNNSFGSVRGMNLLTAPELQTNDFAQDIDGYFILRNGRLETIEGLTETFVVAGNKPVTMLVKITSDLWVFAYDDTVASYTVSTDTVLTLKTGFTSSDPFQGARYDKFVYACNGGDEIGVTTGGEDFLNLTGSMTNFVDGDTVTGGTSGATAVIEDVLTASVGSGAAGTLFLNTITDTGGGLFQNGETITSTSGGSATVSGTLFGFYLIPTAPKATVVHAFGGRLYAGIEKRILWAKQDENEPVPFVTWTGASSPPLTTDPGSSEKRNFGNIRSISSLGGQVVAFYEDGKLGFRIDIVNVDGSGLSQDVKTDFEREDFGGEIGAVSTPAGIFYVNEGGIWQLVSGGATNQPFSEQDFDVSMILGDVFIENIDFTNASIVYDNKRNVVLVSAAEDSTTNNLMIWYSLETKAFGKMSGVFINRFMKDGENIYVGSSLDTQVLKLFDGNENDGNVISRVYQQEVNLAALDNLHDLISTSVKGFFSQESVITVSFDIYDKFGVKTEDFLTFTLDISDATVTTRGFNEFGFSDGFGGAVVDTNNVETRSHVNTPISEFSRLILKVTSEDRAPHEITWMSVETEDKGANTTNQNLILS